MCDLTLLLERGIGKVYAKVKTFLKTLWKEIKKLNRKKVAKDKTCLIFASLMLTITILLYIFGNLIIHAFSINFDNLFIYNIKTILVFLVFIIYFLVLQPLISKLHPKQYIYFPVLFMVGLYLLERYKNYPVTYLSILVIFLLFYVLYYYVTLKYWKPTNWWIMSVVIISLVLLIFGTAFIISAYGDNKLEFRLNNASNTKQKLGTMNCYSVDNKAIIGDNVSCILDPRLKGIKGSIQHTYRDKSRNETPFVRGIEFTIPDRIQGMGFEIEGKDANNVTIKLSTFSEVQIPDYKEYKENHRNLIVSFVSLFVFCLVSVPIIVKNINEFVEKQSSHQ